MKIERLISIIMLLLEHERMTAVKLAEMFEVNVRTIYRDIESICMAGIPIVTFPGVNGGVSIMEGYKIEKKLFTLSDITALLIGLGSIHSTLSNEELMTTMAKVKGLIPAEQFEGIESQVKQVSIDHTPWHENKNLIKYVNEIKTAMNDKKIISFQYYDRLGANTFRKIEPYRLAFKNSSWYIQGYCSTREDFRIFALSRMVSLKIIDETFLPREFDYKSLDVSFRTDRERITLKLLVDESLRGHMLEYCDEENIVNFENNKLIVTFPFVEDDYWYNILLQFGSKCECLEPESVRKELIQRITDMLAIYKEKSI